MNEAEFDAAMLAYVREELLAIFPKVEAWSDIPVFPPLKRMQQLVRSEESIERGVDFIMEKRRNGDFKGMTIKHPSFIAALQEAAAL